MFAESMLETSWAQRARRSWTTLTSFGLQALMIGCLLLLPLWKTIGLPAARTVSTPISLARVAVESAPAPRSRRRAGAAVQHPSCQAHAAFTHTASHPYGRRRSLTPTHDRTGAGSCRLRTLCRAWGRTSPRDSVGRKQTGAACASSDRVARISQRRACWRAV